MKRKFADNTIQPSFTSFIEKYLKFLFCHNYPETRKRDYLQPSQTLRMFEKHFDSLTYILYKY